MNIYNNRGSLVIINNPVIASGAPLVSLYFGTKATKIYKIYWCYFLSKYKETKGTPEAITGLLIINNAPLLL